MISEKIMKEYIITKEQLDAIVSPHIAGIINALYKVCTDDRLSIPKFNVCVKLPVNENLTRCHLKRKRGSNE